MAFCIWLLSVSIIMFSRFIHVVACISTSFLFVAKYNSIVWIYDLLFIYSSFNGHFGLFPLLAIMNNASMNICKFFVWTCNFNSLGYWSYDNSMLNFFLILLLFILFIYFWLRWVFAAVRGLFLAAVSGGYSSLWCAGFSLQWRLLLQSTGSRPRASGVVAHGLWSVGSVVVAHGLSCSAACGVFPDQGSNPCPLHWQADS